MKKAIIFGDSYSTFKGYIPEGYRVYYSEQGRPETDVTRVEETWWHMAFAETDSELILNNSWSGSTIGFTGYDNVDCSKSSSFIHRLEQLIENRFFESNDIDRVFIFGGTNDSWSGAPIGELMLESWERNDLYCVLPAICCFFKTMRNTLPNAEIYALINTELNPIISDGMKKACKHNRITAITFEHIDLRCGHPTVKGMKDIKEQVVRAVNINKESTR